MANITFQRNDNPFTKLTLGEAAFAVAFGGILGAVASAASEGKKYGRNVATGSAIALAFVALVHTKVAHLPGGHIAIET